MLSIHLGDYPGSIYDTSTFFRNSYLDSWFDDPLAAKMIKSVDGSVLIGPHNIVSRQLGSITPLELSGGVKTLLLVRNMPERVFNASTCGDNCARWLLAIGKEQDVLVTMYHIMKFPWKRFQIRIDNDGRMVTNVREFVEATNDFLDVDE